MAIKIAHASIDENGGIKNGNAGDQTGREVCIRTWYDKPWNYVIRFKNAEMREKTAYAMERACNNDNIGYDQSQRNTALVYARNVGYDPGLITAKCETDCSALVTLACIYAGIPEASLVVSGNSATTSTLRKRLLNTGKVEVFYISQFTKSDDYLLRGDILLQEGSHTAVALENGSKAIITSYIYNGIDYSLIFDSEYYFNRYKDLQDAFGNNSDKLFKHFINYGMNESRQACPDFNVTIYKNRYKDLRDAFGNNLPSYYKHYIQYGIKENRIAM